MNCQSCLEALRALADEYAYSYLGLTYESFVIAIVKKGWHFHFFRGGCDA